MVANATPIEYLELHPIEEEDEEDDDSDYDSDNEEFHLFIDSMIMGCTQTAIDIEWFLFYYFGIRPGDPSF